MTDKLPVPVTIITGFLGAGKTTLLNHILRECTNERMAVVLNDFGATSIDAEFIEGLKGKMVSLASGCICCSIRDELNAALAELVYAAEPPVHILIETSGAANPVAVAHTLERLETRGGIRVVAIITVVDAVQVRRMTGEVAQLIEVQILAANTILMNKADLATPEQLSQLQDWLAAKNPEAKVIDVSYGRVPMNILLPRAVEVYQEKIPSVQGEPAPQVYKVRPEAEREIQPDHESLFDVWTYTSKVPLRVAALQAVINQLPENVYRVKGFLHLAECRKKRTILQKSGSQVSMTVGDSWRGRPQTWLMFISVGGALDKAALQAECDACQVPWWSRL